MDNLLLTSEEYRYLMRHKLNFESRHQIKLVMPETANKDYCPADFLVTILGEEKNIKIATDALKKKSEELKIKQDLLVSSSNMREDIPLIILSDSESDTSDPVALLKQMPKRNLKKKKKAAQRNMCTTQIITDNGPSGLETYSFGPPNVVNFPIKRKFTATRSSSEEMLSDSYIPPVKEHRENKKLKPLYSVQSLSTSHSTLSTITGASMSGNLFSDAANETIIILEDSPLPPVQDFIPLDNYSNCNRVRVVKDNSIVSGTNIPEKKATKRKGSTKIKKNTFVPSITEADADNSVILLNEIAVINNAVKPNKVLVPRPLSNAPRVLRPIIIDGSNVARLHGQTQKTYSCKGIQISVDYFLKRGHNQVTVFVPNFRRHQTTGRFPTTDPSILEEMAKIQRVVFTPSRNINGKRLACYDDRFVVELAASTDGVIVSNDNFRDLVNESAEFKKTIEERLLMFLFVGDNFMIPNDPLGANGPFLDEFLSLPLENSS